jgi:hypothetical protein
MSISNRVTLDAIPELSLAQIASLPAEQLMMLQEDLAAAEAKLKKQKQALVAGIAQKYSDREIAERNTQAKPFGVIRYQDGNFMVESYLDKSVEWDQAALADVKKMIEGRWSASAVGDYITTKLDVSERRYTAWPGELQQIFAKARTLKAGTRKQTIKRVA